jgi:hypothetical protein
MEAVKYVMRLIKVVLWSFFGVREGKDHENDFSKLTLWHLIVIGGGVLLAVVVGLVLIVRSIMVAHPVPSMF